MSAANYFKNKWVDILINSILSGVMVFLGFYLTTSDSNARDFKNQLDKKADVDYVDKKIIDHEKMDQARYEGIRDMFEAIGNRLTENQNTTNQRLSDIQEDVRALRK